MTFGNLLRKIRLHCTEIELEVSTEIVDGIIQEVLETNGIISCSFAASRIKELRRCFTAELKKRACYILSADRRKYYTDDAAQFATEAALEAFPSAKYDLTEAGKCFATERFTASVSHLMKAAELSLVSFSSYAGLAERDRGNWNSALNQIRSKMTNKQHPFENMTKDDEAYFVGLEGFLRSAKTAWRNPSSHFPCIYTESQARGLFEVVRILMDSASLKLKEERCPTTEI